MLYSQGTELGVLCSEREIAIIAAGIIGLDAVQ